MNPVSQEYCFQCRFYEALAEYPYQLSSPAKQKCRHLERCQRVAELVKKTDRGQQLDLFSTSGCNEANQRMVQPDIQYLVGDATAPQGNGQKIIAHVCNDINAWGSGFVMALSRRWAAPEQRYRVWHDVGKEFTLGAVQFVPVEKDVVVANMIAQHGIRKGSQAEPPIRYQALEQCLRLVAQRAVKTGASVHMPRIGCGRAGGSWTEVEPIVRRCLTNAGVLVCVYDLPTSSLFRK